MFFCAGFYVSPLSCPRTTSGPPMSSNFLPPLPHLDLLGPRFCRRPIKKIISHPAPNSTTHLVINNVIIA